MNGSYVLNVISDPLGRGWDLLGTAHAPWVPFHPEYAGFLQIAVLLAGLYYALRTGWRFARERYGDRPAALRAVAPVAILSTAVAGGFLWMFVG